MATPTHLVDTSVLSRLARPAVAAAFNPMASRGEIAICDPVAFELGYSARSAAAYDKAFHVLLAFARVPMTDADGRRVREVQRLLVERGHHRAPSIVDALVAAIAEARGLTVLHYDADFELIAAVTGQAQQWIVKRGSVA